MPSRRRITCFFAALCAGCVVAAGFGAEEKKVQAFKILAASHLAVAPGTTTTIKLLGTKLDGATSIVVGEPSTRPASGPATEPTVGNPSAVSAKIIEAGSLNLTKGADSAGGGDKFVTVSLTVPADYKEPEAALSLVTAAGQAAPVRLLVLPAASLVDEKEPNNGFAEAQPIRPGQTVRGVIAPAADVDVFRIEARSGQTLVAEVLARRRHSPLDSLLTLYDVHGNFVASNDDANDTDSLIRYTSPRDAVYYLALTDATGGGGSGHAYLLSLTVEDSSRR